MKNKNRIQTLATVITILFSCQMTIAGTYDAMCGNTECKIKLDGYGLRGPMGYIPAHRIAQWSTGGGEVNNTPASVAGATGGAVGGALAGGIVTCWTLVLCPVGLLAGGIAGGVGGARAGKSADFYFTVIGYNQEGKKIVQNFNFFNKKPAGRMFQELAALSGLGMGELRTSEQIKEMESRTHIAGHETIAISVNDPAKTKEVIDSLLPETLNSDSTNPNEEMKKVRCWNSFIQKPGMRAWVNANPKTAQRVRANYFDC